MRKRHLSKMLRALVGEHVTLQRETSGDLPPICADPGMMEQILVNLSVNARGADSMSGRYLKSPGIPFFFKMESI